MTYNKTHNISGAEPNRFSAYFGAKMPENVCRLGLDIHRLLMFYDKFDLQLQCSTAGADYHRFDDAMKNASEIQRIVGSPHQHHVCSLCTKVEEYNDENGNLRARGILIFYLPH